MLPVVLLMCAWWRRGKIARKDVLRSLPFFALALALGLATVWFQQHNVIRHQIVRPEGWPSRVAATGWIAGFYLFKALVPAGLCAAYPRWDVAASPVAYLPLALIAGAFALLWTRRRSWGRAPLFAMGYFVVTLLPVLGLVNMSFMKFSFVADHLQYAALIGVIAFAAAVLARAAAAAGWPGRAGTFAVAGCVVVLAVLTWDRARLYADGQLLWRDNIAKQKGSWLAWNNLGDVLFRAGKRDEALDCFKRSLALNPKYAVAWHNLGRADALSGRPDEAILDYSKAIDLMPDFASAYNGRGYVLFHAGKYEPGIEGLRKGDRAGAVFCRCLQQPGQPAGQAGSNRRRDPGLRRGRQAEARFRRRVHRPGDGVRPDRAISAGAPRHASGRSPWSRPTPSSSTTGASFTKT